MAVNSIQEAAAIRVARLQFEEQREQLAAERDAALDVVTALLRIVDADNGKAYMTAGHQQLVRRARALLAEHGRRLDE